MNVKVVYFSRTGTSKRVAEKIAKELSCEVIEILDGINWNGVSGYIKAGYYSLRKKDVEIKINGNIDKADEFIVVSPLWAGGPPPAVRTFLKKMAFNTIHLVITSNASDVRSYPEFKSVSEIIKKKNNEDLVIQTLAKKLQGI